MVVVDSWCAARGDVPDRQSPSRLKGSGAQVLRLLVIVSSPAASGPPWRGASQAAGRARIPSSFHVGFEDLALLPPVE